MQARRLRTFHQPPSHQVTTLPVSAIHYALCTGHLRTELLAEESYCDLLLYDQYADQESYDSCIVGRKIAFKLECVSLCKTNTMLPSSYDWGCDGTHKVQMCQSVSVFTSRYCNMLSIALLLIFYKLLGVFIDGATALICYRRSTESRA